MRNLRGSGMKEGRTQFAPGAPKKSAPVPFFATTVAQPLSVRTQIRAGAREAYRKLTEEHQK